VANGIILDIDEITFQLVTFATDITAAVQIRSIWQDPLCQLLPHRSLWQGLTTVTSSWQGCPSVNFNNCRPSSMLQHVWLPAHRSMTMSPRC